MLKNNVSFRPGKSHISNVDEEKSVMEGNSFQNDRQLTEADFESVQESLLFVPRDADGYLPDTKLFKIKK